MINPVMAVAQAPCQTGDLSHNTSKAQQLIEKAAWRGATVVALPELFLSGYAPSHIAEGAQDSIVEVGDEVCSQIQATCASNRIGAIVGGPIRSEDGLVNGALVIAPDGKLLHVYAKTHLWGDEAEAFRAGRGPVIVDFDGFRVGLAICFDAGFPEHVRALGRGGAEAVLCPAAFTHGEERHRYEIYYPARALENTMYTGVANAVGTQGGMEMFGESLICDPRGHELVRASSECSVETVEVDRTEIERSRRDLPYLDEVASDAGGFTTTTIEWR